MFERSDWTLFRNLNTISQKAGVPLQKLRAVVYKEIVDNALDAVEGRRVKFNLSSDGWFTCEDDGPGIDLSPEKMAQLFSINRPLTSTKILRLPSRGALGNGIRVIVGTVMASGGDMRVETQVTRYDLAFDDATGTSRITAKTKSIVSGTKISVRIGEAVPTSYDDTRWATLANSLHSAHIYHGKSSPWWYDSDSFYELFMASGGKDIFWLVPQFEGVNDKNIDAILADAPHICNEMTRAKADELMDRLRQHCKQVNVKKIGSVGFVAHKAGTIEIAPGHGNHSAVLPFLIEAYAAPINENAKDDREDTEDEAIIFTNATPITGNIRIQRKSASKVAMFGCGLSHYIKNVSRRRFKVFLNITIPYMPITTDGKEPNFLYMLNEINTVTSKATAAFKRATNNSSGQREVIVSHVDEGIAAASGNGVYRYSLRQLFYAIRPFVLEQCSDNAELDYNYFARVITEYESINGELRGIYRDPRGTLYHPHLRQSIPIGTLAVEEYERPAWTFRNVLFIEKEGLFEVLKQAKIPERYDLALLSSKGFASRAVKDLIDFLGEDAEEINVFCMHDADGSGTLIYQSLSLATTARAARKVTIHNLGLEPWEGLAMNLQVETFPSRKSGVPVADYVDNDATSSPEDFGFEESCWSRWLQTRRIELNAMSSPDFLAWVEKKLAQYNVEKVIPPTQVIIDTYQRQLRQHLKAKLTDQILRDAGIDKLLETKLMAAQQPTGLTEKVKTSLESDDHLRWDDSLSELAAAEASRTLGKMS